MAVVNYFSSLVLLVFEVDEVSMVLLALVNLVDIKRDLRGVRKKVFCLYSCALVILWVGKGHHSQFTLRVRIELIVRLFWRLKSL